MAVDRGQMLPTSHGAGGSFSPMELPRREFLQRWGWAQPGLKWFRNPLSMGASSPAIQGRSSFSSGATCDDTEESLEHASKLPQHRARGSCPFPKPDFQLMLTHNQLHTEHPSHLKEKTSRKMGPQ